MGSIRKVMASAVTVLIAFLLIATALGCDGGSTGGTGDYQPPRNLTGTFDGKLVALTWEASVNNEETGYEVWRKAAGGSYGSIATLGKVQSYGDETTTEGNTYTYKVRTLYNGNTGPFSNEVTVNT
ncbi:MAG: fibronectin type III domain-containing protein [Candidatus Coatesbacteria bacterium]|nr:MAG: fibronectin type III domain-containing protein [Candidatus Coatesbacteria bacterium]